MPTGKIKISIHAAKPFGNGKDAVGAPEKDGYPRSRSICKKKNWIKASAKIKIDEASAMITNLSSFCRVLIICGAIKNRAANFNIFEKKALILNARY